MTYNVFGGTLNPTLLPHKLHNTVDTRQRISRCTADFSIWRASHRLQLNADGSDLFGSQHNLAKLQHHDVTVTVGTKTIQSVDVFLNLGVWMDHELSMKQHAIKVMVGACFHQLRHLRR